MSPLFVPLLSLALLAGPTVSMEHHGTLRQALNELAKQGHLNLIATGNLDVPAEVTLHDAAPEEALEVVAQAYGLKATHVGKMWVLKPAEEAPAPAAASPSGGEKAAANPVPPMAPVPPVPLVPPVVVNVPPLPPIQVKVGNDATGDGEGEASDDDPAQHLRDAAERARARAEEARDQVEEAKEQAEEAKEKAEEVRQAEQERNEALKEEAQAHEEALKARLELKGRDKSAVSTGPVVVAAGTKVDEAVSYGGPVTVEAGARVDGDAVAFGGDVVLKAGARVDGDAVSFGGRVMKEAGARVDGEEVSFGGKGLGSMMTTKAIEVGKEVRAEEGGRDSRSALARFLVEFAVLFGLGFLCLMFAPARMRSIEAEIRREPVKNGLAGFVAMLASIPLTFVLVITVIGIPIAVLFWLTAGLAVVMGLIAIANVVGEKVPLFRRRRTQALVLALGLFAVLLASRVPVLGPLTMSLATMIAIGAIIRTRMGQRGQGLPVPEMSNQGVPVA